MRRACSTGGAARHQGLRALGGRSDPDVHQHVAGDALALHWQALAQGRQAVAAGDPAAGGRKVATLRLAIAHVAQPVVAIGLGGVAVPRPARERAGWRVRPRARVLPRVRPGQIVPRSMGRARGGVDLAITRAHRGGRAPRVSRNARARVVTWFPVAVVILPVAELLSRAGLARAGPSPRAAAAARRPAGRAAPGSAGLTLRFGFARARERKRDAGDEPARRAVPSPIAPTPSRSHSVIIDPIRGLDSRLSLGPARPSCHSQGPAAGARQNRACIASP